MSRILLLGRAGSGKTQRVVDAVRPLLDSRDSAGKFERFVVLVPTYSAAEHLKRRLLREGPGLAALLDRGIGTFEQLAERETGIRLRGLVPATVKDALLERALERLQLPIFEEVRRFPGFRRSILRFVKEVKAGEPEPGPQAVPAAVERLQAAAGSLPGIRGRKLGALATTLAAYEGELRRAGLRDHEDLLRALLLRLRDRPPGELRLFALDGFSDLTQVQERIVQLLAEHAAASLVALDGDPQGSWDGPFAAGEALYRRLRSGSRFDVETLAEPHRFAGDLARVERRAGGDSVEARPADGRVRFLAGADPADEADRVARNCRRLAAEGIARNDILVVVRRLDGDSGARVSDALRRHGVPFRRFGGTPLLEVPAARSALRMLGLLADVGEPDDLLTALGAGDARGVQAAEADRLRIAARARGARGVEELEELSAAADLTSCSAWLVELRKARPGPSRAAPHRLVEALLVALPRLLAWSFEGAVPPELSASAVRDAAALRRLRDLVSESAAALRTAGKDAVTPADVVRVVRAAAEDARVRETDRRVDVVNVVDAEEARTWEASAVIVTGLAMGQFPAGAREDVFVSDHDRAEVTRRAGVRLPAQRDRALLRERALFYAAVTRARESLILTAPLGDAKGDTVLRSPFLDALLEILPEDGRAPDGAGRTPGDLRPAVGEAFATHDLLRASFGALSARHAPGSAGERHAQEGLALLQRVAARDALQSGRLPRSHLLVRAGRRHVPRQPRLAASGAALRRMSRARRRSASSLASFAQCAYKHFAEKGLGLREAPSSPEEGLDPAAAGSIVHAALEQALRHAAGTAEEAIAHFEAAWQAAAGHLTPSVRLVRDRQRLRSAVIRQVERDAATPLAPGFAPATAEWPFGMGENDPALAIEADGHRVEVRGRVDRLDRDAEGRLIVVDYKWSSHSSFSNLAQRIEEATDLQLPLYALAVARAHAAVVVAAGYLTLRDGKERWLRLANGAPGTRYDVDWTETGGERFAAVERAVVEVDRDIRSGRIDVLPTDPDRCKWCAFGDLCRVDEAPV